MEIVRKSGVVGSTKETPQPTLTITEGKQGRDLNQQADLEVKSIINKYESKGYKDLASVTSKNIEDMTVELFDEYFKGIKTDKYGNVKPMLAKSTDDLKKTSLERHWFASTKLDGTRCVLYWNPEEQVIKTSSRGGKNYDASTKHIREYQPLVDLFKQYPNLKLDGELYKHGESLQSLSGLCRLKEWDEKCRILEFHCYDIIDPDKTFQQRLEFLERLRIQFSGSNIINILEHYPVFGYNQAKVLHDRWVAQGYEGAVLRDPTAVYIPGGRTIAMVKLKEFKDDEFEIVGYTPGLRGTEDMVFRLKTRKGVEFEAKPLGSRQVKEDYVANIDKIIGKKGTVKYFYMTDDGRPFLPVFKTVRDYEN
jgi:DNA ligase-1